MSSRLLPAFRPSRYIRTRFTYGLFLPPLARPIFSFLKQKPQNEPLSDEEVRAYLRESIEDENYLKNNKNLREFEFPGIVSRISFVCSLQRQLSMNSVTNRFHLCFLRRSTLRYWGQHGELGCVFIYSWLSYYRFWEIIEACVKSIDLPDNYSCSSSQTWTIHLEKSIDIRRIKVAAW